MSRNSIFFFLKLFVSAALIALIALNFDLKDSAERLLSLDLGYVGLSIIVFFGLMFNNVFRWRTVMLAIKASLDFWKTFRLLYAGLFFNQTLPSSVGGDAVRMYLARREGLSLQGAINGVMLERMATVSGLILLVVITQPFLLSRIGDNPAKFVFPALAAIAVIGIAVVMLLDRFPERFQKWKIVRGIGHLAADTKRLFLSPVHAVVSVGLGVTGNILIAVGTFCLALSLGVQVTLLDCIVLMPPVILITTIPISIAGWGLREGAMVAAFAFVGVPEGDAFVLSVLFGLMNILIALPGGAIWLLSGYRRKDIEAELRESSSN
jgi:uncharacterized membrane protein YbhN (UPF0104 family)